MIKKYGLIEKEQRYGKTCHWQLAYTDNGRPLTANTKSECRAAIPGRYVTSHGESGRPEYMVVDTTGRKWMACCRRAYGKFY